MSSPAIERMKGRLDINDLYFGVNMPKPTYGI